MHPFKISGKMTAKIEIFGTSAPLQHRKTFFGHLEEICKDYAEYIAKIISTINRGTYQKGDWLILPE
jgi:hypothetical protein